MKKKTIRKRKSTAIRLTRRKLRSARPDFESAPLIIPIKKQPVFFYGTRLISFISAVVIATVYIVFTVSGATNTTIGRNISTTGSLTVSSTTTFNGVSYIWPSADGSSGQVLSTNGSGTLSWGSGSQWTTSGSNIYFTDGNAGVGTTSPSQALSVHGNALLSGNLALANLTATGTLNVSGNLLASSTLQATGAARLYSTLTVDSSLGIGTTSPSRFFAVQGSALLSGDLAVAGLTATGTLTLSGTTGTTTIASGQGFTIGTSQLVLQQGSGRVGIGTTDPQNLLSVYGSADFTGSVGIGSTTPSQTFSVQGNSLFSGDLSVASIVATGTLTLSGTTGTSTIVGGQGFAIGTSQLVVVGATGDIGIGIANPIVDFQVIGKSYFGTETSLSSDLTSTFGTPRVASVGNNNSADGFVNITQGNNTVGARFRGAKTRSTNSDADSVVVSGDNLLELTAYGADGASYRSAAEILMEVDGTPGSSDMPGRIVFSTTPDGSATLNERMRITSGGLVGIGTTSPNAALALENSAVNTKPALLIKAGGAGDGNIAIAVAALDDCRDDSEGGDIVGACFLNDLAELFPVTEQLEGGDIVMFDQGTPVHIKKAQMSGVNGQMSAVPLAGVISTSPAIIFEGSSLKAMGGQYTPTQGKAPLALSGRIPVKVNLEGGDISVGDPITISSMPGVGKKATESGKIIGYALENYTQTEEQRNKETEKPGKIMVFANLTYYTVANEQQQTTNDNTSDNNSLFADRSSLLALIVDTVKSWLADMQVVIEEGMVRLQKLFAEEVNTEKLCLGETCITENEFKILLQNANISAQESSLDSEQEQSSSVESADLESIEESTPPEASSETQ